MTRSIWLFAEFTIKEGQLNTAKELLSSAIKIVEEKDTGILSYEFFFHDDESKFYAIELYKDSKAVLAHMEILSEILPKLFEAAPITRGEVFGNASDELVQALAPSGPQFFKYWGGFTRS